MATPPTFVSFGSSTSFVTQVVSGTVHSVSVTVQNLDLLVVVGSTEAGNNAAGGATLGLPTGGSLSYTERQKPNADNDDSHCHAYLWTATATGNATFNVTSTTTSATNKASGIGVYVFRDASFGSFNTAGNEASGSQPSLAITTAADNSAVVYHEGDWSATDGTTRTWRTINSITPTSGNALEKVYQRNAAAYTAYGAYWSDVGAAGAKTTGLTAPTGHTGNSVVIEVQGSTPAAPPSPPFAMLRPAVVAP